MDYDVPQKEMNKIYKKEKKRVVFFFVPWVIHIWYKFLRN